MQDVYSVRYHFKLVYMNLSITPSPFYYLLFPSHALNAHFVKNCSEDNQTD